MAEVIIISLHHASSVSLLDIRSPVILHKSICRSIWFLFIKTSDKCHTTGPPIRSVRRRGRQLVMHVLLFPLCDESIMVDFLFSITTYHKMFCLSHLCFHSSSFSAQKRSHIEITLTSSHTLIKPQFLRWVLIIIIVIFFLMSVLSSLSLWGNMA